MNKMLIAFTLVLLSISNTSFAHSGGTDATGCHSGSKPYHCHSTTTRKSTTRKSTTRKSTTRKSTTRKSTTRKIWELEPKKNQARVNKQLRSIITLGVTDFDGLRFTGEFLSNTKTPSFYFGVSVDDTCTFRSCATLITQTYGATFHNSSIFSPRMGIAIASVNLGNDNTVYETGVDLGFLIKMQRLVFSVGINSATESVDYGFGFQF